MVVELEDGLYAVNFVPYELGVHTVSVMYREVDIPGKYSTFLKKLLFLQCKSKSNLTKKCFKK